MEEAWTSRALRRDVLLAFLGELLGGGALKAARGRENGAVPSKARDRPGPPGRARLQGGPPALPTPAAGRRRSRHYRSRETPLCLPGAWPPQRTVNESVSPGT